MARSAAIAQVMQLAAALEAVASALCAPDAAALMVAEGALAKALAGAEHAPAVEPHDRAAMAAGLARARAALARCRILGAAASDLVQVSLAAQGRAAGYDRMAMPVAVGLRGAGMKGRL